MPATRITLRRSLAAAAALPLLAVALTACGYGSEAKDDDAKKANVAADGKKLSADTVKIGYFPNLTHATALVGIQEGLFAEGARRHEGQAVDLQRRARPRSRRSTRASIDIGFIGPSPAINGYTKSKGKSLRIIGGSASGGVKLVVNPKKIKTLDDLKGKKIATPQLGNTQDVAFLNWISEKGWKVDAQSGKGDVSVVRTDNKVTPDAYKSGSIDGAWVPEPTASKLVAEGAKVLLDESTLWPDKKFVITNIIVSQKFLKEHPDVVEAVLRGSVKTNAWINANPDKAKASANAALKALIRQGAAAPRSSTRRGSPIQFTDDPLAATLDDGGRARGEGRSAGAARPERHLRPDAAEQGPQGRGQARGRRRRSRRQVTPDPIQDLPGGDDHGTTTLTKAAEAPCVGRRTPPVSRTSRSPSAGPAGTQLVLDDITLDVAPGEFVTLLGASGCGKSTLLNLVAGLDRPTAGSIETPGGRPALMFQEHALFPWLTAGKNIELALRLRGVPQGRAPRGGGAAAGTRPARRARTASGCTSCPAACASGSRWPARSPRTANCC